MTGALTKYVLRSALKLKLLYLLALRDIIRFRASYSCNSGVMFSSAAEAGDVMSGSYCNNMELFDLHYSVQFLLTK